MTELARARAPRARHRAVAWLSLCAFLAVLATLALEMRLGRDPAVHAGAALAAPKRVLVRRIVKRTVVVDVVPPASQGAQSGGAALAAGAPSAPASSAPAPAPAAAAPAPAPAPVTRSS